MREHTEELQGSIVVHPGRPHVAALWRRDKLELDSNLARGGK